MARPRTHLMISVALAWWGWRRWGTPAALAALAGGVLVDADHLIDYAFSNRGRRRTHYFAPLHGWELPGVLALVSLRAIAAGPDHGLLGSSATTSRSTEAVRTGPPAAARANSAAAVSALLLSWTLHLIVDLLTNRPRHAGVYLLLYRLRHGFRREITGWDDDDFFHAWTDQPWWTWM